MTNFTHDLIIIGGGAAGCFAAVIAAEQGLKTLLIEPGRLMHKLLITGKGRCNLTNNSDTETILKNIKTNPRFMQSCLNGFTSTDVMSFFENLGVRLKTERGNRVFPVSDKAEEIVNALNNRMNILGVKIINDRAISLITEENAVKGIKCEKNSYFAPKLIIATGGKSYPKTGSTGDGYKLAQNVGHTIIEPKPALVPINTVESCADMTGLSLKNVKFSLISADRNKVVYTEQGEMLFTHFGVSGPLALTASCYVENNQGYKILIDLKPALDEKKLDVRILRDFAENKNKQIGNVLISLLPKSLIHPVLSRANIHPDKEINSITAEERKRLLGTLKGFELTVKNLRPIDEAVITDGGICTREINPKTMESKLVKGLYFAGEVIDVAAFTGGFNLQIAFSTAYAAAQE